ncbi:hypothetical protein B0H10DRAFT_2029293, partial [Mycena sp. CBHHK59/15]
MLMIPAPHLRLDFDCVAGARHPRISCCRRCSFDQSRTPLSTTYPARPNTNPPTSEPNFMFVFTSPLEWVIGDSICATFKLSERH